MRLGLARLLDALGSRDTVFDDRQDVMLDRALLRFERARRAMPDDPELAFYIAYALTRWRRVGADGAVEDRSDEAMAEWRRLRALDPGFLPDRVAYELAMLHMRRQEFREARAEYERSLAALVPQPVMPFYLMFAPPPGQEGQLYLLYSMIDEANLRGNLAEVTMLVGDLRAAIVHYDAAIRLADSAVTRNLAQWGRALALERSGDHNAALEAASRAMREDPIRGHPDYAHLTRRHGSFAILHLPFVFFEPACEIHAYEALGHEASSRADGVEASAHRRDLARALRSWRRYLSEGGAVTRFGNEARAEVERLERLTASAR
jgi:tetratricopeptide (TPR) repeat protein